MTISSGSTILAADINAIKADVDAFVSSSALSVTTSETTTSTSYTDLTTSGPSVTLTTGTTVLIVVSAQMSNSSAGQSSLMAYAISGATSTTPADARAFVYESGNANDQIIASFVDLRGGLTAGSNTFTAKYRVSGGTGTFQHRRIAVIPLGD